MLSLAEYLPFGWVPSILFKILMLNQWKLTPYNSMRTEITYLNPIRLKESSSEGANHLITVIYSSKFVKIGGKLKEEIVNSKT